MDRIPGAGQVTRNPASKSRIIVQVLGQYGWEWSRDLHSGTGEYRFEGIRCLALHVGRAT